ncbi:MAG TPA: xanthine dehydrogenase molybdopterin binding subunit [Chthoniobacterales bacterium]|jgi:xanthine dehydrogenase molybdopterin binding subunit/xanthine dehydrogenase small subunit
MSRAIRFHLNGEPVQIEGVSTNTTLADWLRASGRTGTKIGCAEGDCGACSVAVVDHNAAGQRVFRAINGCIAPLPTMEGREVITVEGVAQNGEMHPVQASLVRNYGSQCGYCTPGFVMSMFEGYYREDLTEKWQIADQLAGNLCRCTGYRPIRDAAVGTLIGERSADSFSRLLDEQPQENVHPSYESGSETFFRPASLEELFALRAAHLQARFVAGATELGVELNKKFLRLQTWISLENIAELTGISETANGWRIGAAATLTQVEEALAGEFPSLHKMLRVFASRQIRNRATLGGNLVHASPLGDAAPLLLSLDASVVLAAAGGERVMPLAEFFVGYRATALREDEVLSAVLIPKRIGWREESYKVSKRREMDISIVSAAFAVKLGPTHFVEDARIAFGGVAATPKRALDFEAALIGRRLDDLNVMETLETEFSTIDDVRGSAAYRTALILGLWHKFVTGDSDGAPDLLPTFEVAAPTTATCASHSLAHESAVGHVCGSAMYVDDVASRRRMLEIWPVMAPHARARILDCDVSEAARIPGVVRVLVAEDIPGLNDVGASIHDEILLADQEVFFHGQIIAAVVGETLEACRLAAEQVKVTYEVLPHLLTIPEAIAAESFHTEPNFMRRGDWRAGLDASAFSLEGEFEIGGQEHLYLETHAAWAEIDGEGNVLISSSTQHPSEIQATVSHVLNLPRNRIIVQAPRMGGGFGGKETQGNTWAALVALAAWKTGRPVRVQIDRDLDMRLTGKRHPFLAKFSAGFEADGKLNALHCALLSNGGWSLDLSMPVTDRAMFHIDNAYYIPHLKVSGQVVKTNITSQTAFRGFGGPQGMLVIEEILARISNRLGMAPEAVRERNFYHGSGETNTTHYGQEIEDNRLLRIWSELKESSDFDKRKEAILKWNASSGQIKRGLGITPVKFGISFTLTYYNQAGAHVVLYVDGTAQVNHGGAEMGQGLHTKIQGVVMRELGLRADQIRMMTTSTDKVPNTSATAASSGSDLNGAAVANACAILKERLRPLAEETLGAGELVWADGVVRGGGKEIAFAQLALAAHTRRINLSANGFYATPEIHWNRQEGKGKPFNYYTCGAAVAEVEVDGYTGMTQLRRVDILQDVGSSLNPGVDRGQVEGGFVQGVGWLTREELIWDPKTGRLLTHSASTYEIPAFSDAPAEFNIAFLQNAENPRAIHGSKGIGEPPLMLAISVREAIRDAVVALGGSGSLSSPATGEAILAAIHS